MEDIVGGFIRAFHLLTGFDATLVEIVGRSLMVSLSAVALAAAIGLPLGATLALARFPGRRACLILVNAAMGLPPVVVGLALYLLMSRSGPFGVFGLLFTPEAMIIAQAVLVAPIITALTRQAVEDLWRDYHEHLRSLGATPLRAVPTLLWDGRVALFTALLAGFGRASAEVGAVMIVGGNIDHVTRVMTTAIALETSRGDLALALALGLVLLTVALAVNVAAFLAQERAARSQMS
jgi:tungstate transport system permease protein